MNQIMTILIYDIFLKDEDLCGDHHLAEARVSLVKIFPQMQKQFQVITLVFSSGTDLVFLGLPSPSNIKG